MKGFGLRGPRVAGWFPLVLSLLLWSLVPARGQAQEVSPPVWQVTDGALLQPLAVEMFWAGLQRSVPAFVAPCAQTQPLAELLAQAEDDLLLDELEQVSQRLVQAERALLCLEEPAPRVLLERLVFLQALLEVQGATGAGLIGGPGGEPGRWLSRYGTLVSPSLVPTQFPERVVQAFARAREAGKKPAVTVRMAEGLPPLLLWLDGAALKPTSGLSVVPGDHLLQVFKPAGSLVAAFWLTVPVEGGRVRNLPPPELLPPTGAWLVTELRNARQVEDLSPALTGALSRLASASGGRPLLIHIPDGQTRRSRWLRVMPGQLQLLDALPGEAGGGVPAPVMSRAPVVSEPVSRVPVATPPAVVPGVASPLPAVSVTPRASGGLSRLLPVVAVSGAVMVAGGGFYLQQYLSFNQAHVSQAEANAILRRVQVGRMAGLLGAAGVTVGLSWHFWGPGEKPSVAEGR